MLPSQNLVATSHLEVKVIRFDDFTQDFFHGSHIFQETLDNRSRCDYHSYMIRSTFHLTKKQIAALKTESKRTGLSVAELIRRAIDTYLKEQK